MDDSLILKIKLDTREANRKIKDLKGITDDFMKEAQEKGAETQTAKQTDKLVSSLDSEVDHCRQKIDELSSSLASMQKRKGELFSSIQSGLAKDFKALGKEGFAKKYDGASTIQQALPTWLGASQPYRAIEAEIDNARASQEEYNAAISQSVSLRSALLWKLKTQIAEESKLGQGQGKFSKILAGISSVFGKTTEAARRFGESAGSALQGLGTKALRVGLSIMGVRAIFAGLRRAVSAYLSDNQATADKINSIWATLGNAIGPVIDWIADKIMGLLSLFSGLMKVLFGVNISIKKAAKSSSGQAKAAKESAAATKRQLASFDEMNKLNDESQTGSGSGGGGGGSGSGYEIIQSDFKPWDALQDAINSGDWVRAGEELANKVNETVAKIDWKGIGTSIGKGYDKAFKISYGFLKNLDTKQIGSGLAELINNALENFDTTYVGGTIAQWWNKIWGLALGFVSELDWKQLGRKIADAVSGVFRDFDYAQIVETVYTGVLGIWDMLLAFATNLDYGAILSAITEGIGAVIGSAANLFTEQIYPWLSDAWEAAKDWFYDLFFENGEFTWDGFLEGITDAVTSVGKWLKENVMDPFVKGFKKAFGIASPAKIMKPIGRNIIEGVWEGVKTAWKTFWKNVKEKIDEFIDKFSETWETIKKNAEEAWKKITSVFSGAWESITGVFKNTGKWFGETFGGAYENVKGAFSGAPEWFKGKFETAYANVKNAFSSIGTWFSDKYVDVKNAFANTAKWFGDTFDKAYKNVKNAFSGSAEWAKGVWEGIKGKFTGVGSWFSNTFSGLSSAFDTVKTSVLGSAGKLVENLKTKLKGCVDNLNLGTPTVTAHEIYYEEVPSRAMLVPKKGGAIRLAQGGIVVRPTFANIGEAGKEAVLPLERNTEWMDEFVDRIASAVSANGGTLVINLDGREIARAVNRANRKMDFAFNS